MVFNYTASGAGASTVDADPVETTISTTSGASSTVIPSTGIRRPIITFSLSPINLSSAPSRDASVKTFVVSWKDAALSHESENNDDFVTPRIV